MFTKNLLRVILIATVTLLTFNISPGSAEKLSLQSLPARQSTRMTWAPHSATRED